MVGINGIIVWICRRCASSESIVMDQYRYQIFDTSVFERKVSIMSKKYRLFRYCWACDLFTFLLADTTKTVLKDERMFLHSQSVASISSTLVLVINIAFFCFRLLLYPFLKPLEHGLLASKTEFEVGFLFSHCFYLYRT